MANEEHVEVIKQGAEAWKEWGERNLDYADLRGANLSKIYLYGARLHKADFRDADLTGATLMHTVLVRAQFNGANLKDANLGLADLLAADFTEADLSHANLNRADLTMANLSRANLTGANLRFANLQGATLFETDFSKARIERTSLTDLDLSTARGLDTIEHGAPSSISIDTIYRSGAKIPEIFLRRAGVPDNFIGYIHSLGGKVFEYYSCFISYSSKDQSFADRLYADLLAKGVRCWLATEDLKIGDKFRQEIDDSIRLHDKLLVILSQSSVKSSWVESEVETAFERESQQEGRLVLFPIRLDDAVMETNRSWAADIRRKRHIGDFRRWHDENSYKKAFERLLRDLQGHKK